MEYRSCPYNFNTCARSLCENWGKYGCGLFRNITSLDELKERLNNLNDTENLTVEIKNEQCICKSRLGE